MADNVVIVESPAKIKSLGKYFSGLKEKFEVFASYGHVRDLISKTGAVEPDNHFAMNYELIERNINHLEKIMKALKKAKCLYLATDPDREGEAIAWHICEYLREQGALKGIKIKRIVFHEITKDAVLSSLEKSRSISDELVNAQQARRALDHLVGFYLSPLLWRKVAPGLSAGRVQSPALRLVAEREAEIKAFVSREYWTIVANLKHQKQPFVGRLTLYQDEKVEQFTVTNAEQADAIRKDLEKHAKGKLLVTKVEKKTRKRSPAPPFITSTLQQEASRKLGFGAQRTMRAAQKLYEGVAIDGDVVGLITYMRTDSVNISKVAMEEVRQYIVDEYGEPMLPEAPNVYKTKSNSAQEAHEAIRPTSVQRTPKQMKKLLANDEGKLYELIWKRFVACQMIPATMAVVAVDMACGKKNNFRANGSTIQDPGFITVYQEGVDDKKKDEGDSGVLPELKEGDTPAVKAIEGNQHFTEPPPRYTEATLVKALEHHDIGRPSTYATIISTIQSRQYVEQENKRFFLTDIGNVVNHFLTEYFDQYVDYDFTAKLEARLDAIAAGKEKREPLLKDFWEPFIKLVDRVGESVTREEVGLARHIGQDPETGKPVSVRVGRFGPFVQIGTKDDEEKPKFAGLRPDQKMEEITLEDALVLFTLPRDLGETAEGEPMIVNVGRFGPYVKYGDKYVSIKEDDPYTISRRRALNLVKAKKEADAKKLIAHFEPEGISVLNGRFGPYVTDGSKNAKVPKDQDPAKLTVQDCQTLIAEAPDRKWGRRGGKKSDNG